MPQELPLRPVGQDRLLVPPLSFGVDICCCKGVLCGDREFFSGTGSILAAYALNSTSHPENNFFAHVCAEALIL